MTSRTRSADAILARLHSLHPLKIDLSLGRIEGLLAKLGHPERLLPPVVHIAGTNGKGSTLAFMDAMLTAAGRRVHRYISPHLVRFNERILLHGREIEDALLEELLEACERANGGEPITFFEITTAAAFLAFARVPADVVLLETGLGGRLDATNVVERPLLTLITPVSMDHESFLGSTLSEIAGEKAGILKRGVPAVVGPQAPSACDVIEARAEALSAPLVLHGRDWTVQATDHGILVQDGEEPLELPAPSLPGIHQIGNAGLAVVAARRLGLLAPDTASAAAGLTRARWAARLQRLVRGPFVEQLGTEDELWLDGGHNPAAGEVLAQSLPALARGRPAHLVIGMLASKDLEHFVQPLLPLAASITTVPVPEEAASRDPETAAELIRAMGVNARPMPSVEAALAAIRQETPGPVLVLICGSLYLAGHVLRMHG